MNIESLADHLTQIIPTVSDAPGRGVLALIKSPSQNQIQTLALAVASKYPSGPVPVYVVQGGMLGEHAWPFSSIRKRPRTRLDRSDFVVETGGTIFPEDRPIVLLAEDFDLFDASDQRAYCHLVDGEGLNSHPSCSLHQGSVLICGYTGERTIEPGSSSRGFGFELDG